MSRPSTGAIISVRTAYRGIVGMALAMTISACSGPAETEPTHDDQVVSGREKPTTAPVPAGSRVTLSTGEVPIAQSPSGTPDRAAFSGRVKPANEGAEVLLERRRPDGSWSVIARAAQGRHGRFRGVYAARAQETLRASSAPRGTNIQVVSTVDRRRAWPLVFEDDFNGSVLDGARWYTRHQPMHGSRMCSQPAEDRVRVAGGVATLSVRKFDRRTSVTCPYGRFHNAMIGTTPQYRFQRGVFAARVKFQAGQGMHGAFWLQGPGVIGAEIDVAEYFGVGSPEELTILVHHTDAAGTVRTAGKRDDELPTTRVLGPGRTPADGFHVYAVEWDADRYRFFLDGQLMMTTRKPFVSQAPEEIILSLLTSDWELRRLESTKSVMEVDWVRIWQPRSGR